MDKFDEVNPYETNQQNDFNIEIDPVDSGFAGQQGYAQPNVQPPQQNYQAQQYAQPNVQPPQQNYQAQQYAQPNVQPPQQNYQAQQYAQPNVQTPQQNYQAQQYPQPYDPNAYGANYGYQQYFYQNNIPNAPRGSAKGLGIAGMVCGIVSIVSSLYIFSGFIAGILGLIFSIVSKKKSAEQGVSNSKATVGLILSIIGLAITAFLLFCVIVYAVNDPEGFRRTLREALD